jgi:hypothetical protein
LASWCLGVRCSCCRRTFYVLWSGCTRGTLDDGMANVQSNRKTPIDTLADCYAVLANVRKMHERRGPTCCVVLKLKTDLVPFKERELEDVAREITNDAYFTNSVAVAVSDEQPTTLCESVVAAERGGHADADFEAQLDEAFEGQIISVDALVYFAPKVEFELGSVVHAPRNKELIVRDDYNETEFVELNVNERRLVDYGDATRNQDQPGADTLRILPFLRSNTLSLLGRAGLREPLFQSFMSHETRLDTFSYEGHTDGLKALECLSMYEANNAEKSNLEKQIEASMRNEADGEIRDWCEKYVQFKNDQRAMVSALVNRMGDQSWSQAYVQMGVSGSPLHRHAVKRLVDAGFFFLRDTLGTCVCFWCGLSLTGWTADAVPLIEHARHSIECPFLLLLRGRHFVTSALQLYPPRNARTRRARLDDALRTGREYVVSIMADRRHVFSILLSDEEYQTGRRVREEAYSNVLHFLSPQSTTDNMQLTFVDRAFQLEERVDSVRD